MNIIDKTVSFFSPKLGLERAEQRAKLEKKRSYEAATKARRGDGWSSRGNQSVNEDIQKSLHILRERSIHGYKNNSTSFSAHRKIQNNVIGTGIMPTPVAAVGEKALTDKEINVIKTEWKAFAETKACDFNNMMFFGGIQSLIMRTLSTQGEVFILKRRDAKSRIPFQLQVLAPHMVDINKNSFPLSNSDGSITIQGVEFDAQGRKTGYWLFDSDPRRAYAKILTPSFVSIKDMIQVYYIDFPDQVRGVPFGVSAMLNMRDLDDYEDAALMAMKVSACHVGVTTSEAVDLDGATHEYDDYDHIEPGMIMRLRPGEEMNFNTTNAPTGFGEYVTKNQQKNAAGFGITYEQLTGDMSNVNFSSGRMGWIEAQRQIEDWQYNVIIPQLCVEIWDWFIEGLNVKGIINKKVSAEWTPPGREMIDPVKEMNGLILEMKSGLISWTEACKRRGYNPEVLMEQIKKDKATFEAAGINVEWIIQPEAAADPSAGAGGLEGTMTPEDLKRVLDAYGVGVRAGSITPTENDEQYFRSLAKFPEMSEAVIKAWKDDGGFRRPITLAVPLDNSEFAQ